MSHPEFHVLQAELIADRRTTRYSCPSCQRCFEDGPEGLRLIFAGDRDAVHRGGPLAPGQLELQRSRVAQPVLH